MISGYRARRRLLELSVTKGTTKAFVGMMLGLFSFFVGAMIIFAAPTTNLDQARRTTALAAAVSIESAINDFYIEYRRVPGRRERVVTGSAEGGNLLEILLGLEGVSPGKLNVHSLKFLSVREGKNRKNGLIYGPSGRPEGLFDPYGNSYTVILDTDGDEKLRFEFARRPVELTGRRVAVISAGKDGKLGSSDDIKTW